MNPSIAAVVIILTGVLGNIFAESFLRLLGVKESVARGLAIGTSAHALGTARALELGETEGAMIQNHHSRLAAYPGPCAGNGARVLFGGWKNDSCPSP